jgi:hypothetical protein
MGRVLKLLPILLFLIAAALTVAVKQTVAPATAYFIEAAIYAWYAAAIAGPTLWLATGSISTQSGVSSRDRDSAGFWGGVLTYSVVLWGVALIMHWALRRAS